MTDLPQAPFEPLPVNRSGIVSWTHLGDLHMVRTGEQNHRDLQAIVDEINGLFAGKGVNFVYLPGDIADDGSQRAYAAVRTCLDRLQIPWCGIVGDHDVHEKSFDNFRSAIDRSLYSAFTVGDVRFFRLNTFSEPRPDAFIVDSEQLDWLERELSGCGALRPVVLMHCYPSDLKQGGERLTELLHRFRVRLVDMGHTHYNEISNDGVTLYSATRSTGQIEEGPVGYTVISIDGDSVCWQFVRLGTSMLVAVTSPSDERLLAGPHAEPLQRKRAVQVCIQVWSRRPVRSVSFEGFDLSLSCKHQEGTLWSVELPAHAVDDGVYECTVRATDEVGETAEDRVRLAVGAQPARQRAEVDQENALGEWSDRDLLGTQLGPNKNGKKW